MIRILILGYGPMGLSLVRGVMSCPDIAIIMGVFPWSNHPRERFSPQEQSENSFRQFIRKHNLPVINARGANHYSFIQILTSLKPDLVLVGSWGEIFRQHILELSGICFINCHPSRLPFHRGANPFTSVIIQGETSSGVTFHIMDRGIDTGPIVMQRTLVLNPDETGLSLRARCADLAESMLPELLQQFSNGTLEALPQSSEEGSYDKITPDIGWISWYDNPYNIERKIRGLYPWFDSLALLEQRTTVAFRFGRLVPLTPALSPSGGEGVVGVGLKPTPTAASAEPGIIFKNSSEGLFVTTTDPELLLLLQRTYFPRFSALMTPLLKAMLLKPGKRLSSGI